jgi:Flp pilus assembly protein TadG
MKRLPDACVRRHRQRGVFVIAGALMLVPIIAFFGLALDVTFAYARRAEMQDVADAAALAAARALDGTPAGVQAARDAAAATAALYKYSWGSAQVTWNDAALTFSDDPDAAAAGWLPMASVTAANVGRMSFARVDTRELRTEDGVALGSVTLLFMQKFIGDTTIEAGGRAVAGPTATRALPLAICAMHPDAASSRAVDMDGVIVDELLEYGFRRGVGYNLLNLSSEGATPLNYAINPLDFPSVPEQPLHNDTATLRKFVCDGSILAPRLRNGSQVYVSSPFPPELGNELNSRFDVYTSSSCNDKVAVPDTNIRQYNATYSKWWISPDVPAPKLISAAPAVIDGKLATVADGPTAAAPKDYGTVWAFSRPVRRDPSAPGEAGEPFETADWKYLYAMGLTIIPGKVGSVAPYFDSGAHRVAPAYPKMPRRRILYVPLLQCPVSGATANVAGVGRFLMLARATPTTTPPAIHAEFGGLAADAELGTSIGLYR